MSKYSHKASCCFDEDSPSVLHTMSKTTFDHSLARQRKPQVTRCFTTQMLRHYKLKLDSEDYK